MKTILASVLALALSGAVRAQTTTAKPPEPNSSSEDKGKAAMPSSQAAATMNTPESSANEGARPMARGKVSKRHKKHRTPNK